MTDSKLTGLTESSDPAADDWFYVVDRSDTTDDAAGSSRKIKASLAGGMVTEQNCDWDPNGGGGADQFSIPGSLPAGSDTVSMSNADYVYAAPFLVLRDLTITQAAIRVTAANSPGNMRLGIYNANQSTGEMTTLVSDLGTVSISNQNLIKTGTLSVALTPGLYWSAWVMDGAGSSPPCNLLAPECSLLGMFDTCYVVDDSVTPFVVSWASDQTGTTPSTSGFPSDATAWTWIEQLKASTFGIRSAVVYKWV